MEDTSRQGSWALKRTAIEHNVALTPLLALQRLRQVPGRDAPEGCAARGKIILTSEDARYLVDHVRYTKDGRWRFILNPADTAKGTGTLQVMAAQNHSMHDIFLSMFTSLHLQVGGRISSRGGRGQAHGLGAQTRFSPSSSSSLGYSYYAIILDPVSPHFPSSSPSTTSSTRGATTMP